MQTIVGFSTLLLVLDITKGQFYECPLTWVSFQEKCYYFNYYPEYDYNRATGSCSQNGASLLSVNSAQEHDFIVDQLKINDAEGKQWYTSGRVNNIDTGDLRWDGDGSIIRRDLYRWFSEQDRVKIGERIVYKSEGGVYGWSRVLPTTTLPFICEISRAEAFRIDQENRDFTYGTNLTDPLLSPRGPVFILQPQSIIVVANARTPTEGEHITATIECFAEGNPLPSYRIFHTTAAGTDIEITSTSDGRYTLAGGRLVITDPQESKDAGTYQCLAYNNYGHALSDTANITFGVLSEFSNVQRAPVIAQEYLGAVIECDPPTYKPAVTYQWYRASDGDFVRPDLNPRAFISSNGKLYFSEVTPTDSTDYVCLVKLTSTADSVLATEQPPSSVSLPIPLQVNSQASITWGPEFADDFIAVFPNQPLRGNLVKLECLAYGTLPLTYSWTRKDYPLPDRTVTTDNNRILEISDIQLDDGGTYTCTVSRTTGEVASRDHQLFIEAKPYFVFPLLHQHADVGSQLTWRCEAMGVPRPVYFWYRNGEELIPIPGEMEIHQNVLVIYNLNAERHNGMYQCAAYNVHGVSHSSAQLRVMAFKPSFVKHPLDPSQSAALGAATTIICSPEAAPKPEYTWTKDGVPLNLPVDDGVSRVRKLSNGNLYITEVQYGDAGRYGCTATNQLGTDSSFGNLHVVPNTVITVPPANTLVRLNSTAMLTCVASFPANIDSVYLWRFNGRNIDFTNHPHYKLDASQPGVIYIVTAQFYHAGWYECVAKTTHDEIIAGAILSVEGPPSESAGVTVDSATMTSTSARLYWTAGASNGRPIDYHIIEGKTEFLNGWSVLIHNIPFTVTQVLGTDRHSFVVDNLKPGNGYQFRVRAVNMLGIGLPSKNTGTVQTHGAAPEVYPRNVGGGGGSVGTLTITWDPLPPEDQGGPGIGYIVAWRLRDSGIKFEETTVQGDLGVYTHTVGRENFYLQYEVKVTAFNDFGIGPTSPVGVYVYSAEDLPIGVATNVYAWPYNCTAAYVSWTIIPNDRINMRGTLLGYQVNYKERFDPSPIINSISWRGESDRGLVIGLDPYKWYTVDVQVLNTAGMGPRSEFYHVQTYRAAPSLYPVEVYVHSHTMESVLITWRGVSTKSEEEALEGYIVRYWQTTDDIRSATDVLVDRVTTEVAVWGLQKDTVYELRVLGYSRGGDGKMSEASFFTLGGSVAYDPSSSEILAAADKPQNLKTLIVICVGVLTVFERL